MQTTEGFYKYQEDLKKLLYAPNFVLNKDYEMRKENKDEYTYPIDGWYWFDSDLTARQFFNVPEESEPKELTTSFQLPGTISPLPRTIPQNIIQ